MSTKSSENDRPPTPADEDCCGQGCDPCIFDVHKKLVEDWERKKLQNDRPVVKNENYLSLLKYKKFVVADITKTSEDCIFMELQCNGLKKR